MGEGKESARAQVLAARALVDEELVRLEASARAAVDVKAKVKRNPVKAAGLAAGAGFVVVGGPRRCSAAPGTRVFGQPDPLPKSMLPEEIDASLSEAGLATASGSAASSSASSRATSRTPARRGSERDLGARDGADRADHRAAARAALRLAARRPALRHRIARSYGERLAMIRARVRAAAGTEPEDEARGPSPADHTQGW